LVFAGFPRDEKWFVYDNEKRVGVSLNDFNHYFEAGPEIRLGLEGDAPVS